MCTTVAENLYPEMEKYSKLYWSMLYAGICVWIFSLPSAPAAAEPGPAGARPRERWDADDDNDENGDDGDDDDGRNQPPKTAVLHELEGTSRGVA